MGLIYLDSCLLIYAIEEHPLFGAPTNAALARDPETRFAVSPLVKFECLVGPLRNANLALQRRYEDGLSRLVQLQLTDAVFMQAAVLRARFGLRTPDALHLACAQHHGCGALWTNDERLARAAHGLAQNILGS